jgi:hypothetical protein
MYFGLYASMETWYRQWFPPGARLAYATVIGMSAFLILNISSAAILLENLDHPALAQAFFGRFSITPWAALIVVAHSIIAYFRRADARPGASVGDRVTVAPKWALLYFAATLMGFVSVVTFVIVRHND